MKRMMLVLITTTSILAWGQGMSPVKSYAGLKIGFNYGNFDPGNSGNNLSGAGFQAGFAFGMDLARVLGFEFAPAFRTSEYATTVLNVPVGVRYINLWLPVNIVFKAGMIPVVTPYFGFSIAGNFQLDGTGYIGEAQSDISDLENDAYTGLILGTDIKLSKVKIVPEFSFNFNLTADSEDTPNVTESVYDIHLQVGMYYAP
ncbi:MAG TPA: hypothetical protein VF399_08650 [bacterium]|jgi:hypothetical protein